MSKRMPLNALRSLCAVLLLLAAAACTTEIYAPAANNPPPSTALQTFGHFQLKPVQLNPQFAEHGYNQSARAAIDRNLQMLLVAQFQVWDREGGRTLLIEPYIEQIKFIGGAARFWAGWMAGSSAVVMRVTYRDADTQEVIATPVFYQHANAFGGAASFGATDNDMLKREAELIAEYTRINYAKAVGGLTGAPADRVRPTS